MTGTPHAPAAVDAPLGPSPPDPSCPMPSPAVPFAAFEAVDYVHGGVRLRGRVARPAGPGPHPAVLVVHDARGLGSGTMRQAAALADLGYLALAADMYGDGAFHADPRDAGPTMGALIADPALLRARALAGLDALIALSGVDPARVGAFGFCFGGRCVLEIARAGAAVAGVASFHGLLTTGLPARPGAVRAKVLVLTGALDPYAPQEDVEGFQREMAAAGADYHLTVYGQGRHAFADDGADTMAHITGVRYDPLLAHLSWAQATAFLAALT